MVTSEKLSNNIIRNFLIAEFKPKKVSDLL